MFNPSAMVTALVVVLLLLGLVLRWVFASPRRVRNRTLYDATDAPDLGLLSVVVSRLSRQDALARRAALQEAGIRSSMSPDLAHIQDRLALLLRDPFAGRGF